MNNEYICKIGNVEDIKKYFDAKIKDNLEDNSYKVYKNHFIQAFEDKTRLFYFGYLNGEIITRAVAIISKEDKYIQNKDGLIDKNKAYLTAFETKKSFNQMAILNNFMPLLKKI